MPAYYPCQTTLTPISPVAGPSDRSSQAYVRQLTPTQADKPPCNWKNLRLHCRKKVPSALEIRLDIGRPSLTLANIAPLIPIVPHINASLGSTASHRLTVAESLAAQKPWLRYWKGCPRFGSLREKGRPSQGHVESMALLCDAGPAAVPRPDSETRGDAASRGLGTRINNGGMWAARGSGARALSMLLRIVSIFVSIQSVSFKQGADLFLAILSPFVRLSRSPRSRGRIALPFNAPPVR